MLDVSEYFSLLIPFFFLLYLILLSNIMIKKHKLLLFYLPPKLTRKTSNFTVNDFFFRIIYRGVLPNKVKKLRTNLFT